MEMYNVHGIGGCSGRVEMYNVHGTGGVVSV